MLSSEELCDIFKIATSRTNKINNHPFTNPGTPGAMVYMEIIRAMSKTAITKQAPPFAVI
jgi:hypothetical protein